MALLADNNKYLVDSNILIYSFRKHIDLRELITDDLAIFSEISRVEVLSYHGLKDDEEYYYDYVFNFVPIIFPSPEIFEIAIKVRKLHKLKLGDSLIAATALEHNLTLYTHNIKDFNGIKGLKCIDPIK